MAKTTVELPEVLHRTLRVKAALENRSMNDIMIAAVRGYLQNFRVEQAMLDGEATARSNGAEATSNREV